MRTFSAPSGQNNQESQSRIMRFIQQSKELVRFYKDGLKQIWTDNKQSKALLTKVANEGYVLNRSEFQLVHQTQKNMVKLIPFGFVFLILPESIPLLVMYVPGMVPSTCLKESQIRKQREKLDKVRQKMTMNVLKSAEQVEGISPEDFLHRHKFQKIAKQYGYDFELSQIDRRHLSSYCRFMGINDYGPQFVLKHRLQKYMDYLDKDDKLLLQENTVDTLDAKELSHAVEERGMRSLDREEEEMRRALKYWLTISQQSEPKVPAGLLVFSRMFLLNASYSS
ncbi:LETM1-like protein-domain-containing protein [Choanephora cucurbitarum]|nr:LETM1-like protein-domain-containing protein [Choanephora cucurbitarum]